MSAWFQCHKSYPNFISSDVQSLQSHRVTHCSDEDKTESVHTWPQKQPCKKGIITVHKCVCAYPTHIQVQRQRKAVLALLLLLAQKFHWPCGNVFLIKLQCWHASQHITRKMKKLYKHKKYLIKLFFTSKSPPPQGWRQAPTEQELVRWASQQLWRLAVRLSVACRLGWQLVTVFCQQVCV